MGVGDDGGEEENHEERFYTFVDWNDLCAF
jgi:hypothetical protein